MKLIIGLGNPGEEYRNTRHNMGFSAIDCLAQKHEITVKKLKHHALIGEGNIDGERVVLAKPMTYMNASGEAVAALVHWYKTEPTDLLVIYDDMDLPFGQLRLRESGSAGGHNGMKSILLHLGTDRFLRLRIGIGRPKQNDTVGYVLGGLNTEEKATLDSLLVCTCDAVDTWIKGGAALAMNRFNRRVNGEKS